MKVIALVLALGATPAPAQHHVPHHWRHHRAPHRSDIGILAAQLFKPPKSNPKAPTAPPMPAAASLVAQLQATLATWQAADAIAVGTDPAHPLDPQGHACYGAMVAFLGALPSAATSVPVSPSAPILEAARARVGRLASQVPIATPKIVDVRASCANLIVESDADFLARLSAWGGLSVDAGELAKAGIAQ